MMSVKGMLRQLTPETGLVKQNPILSRSDEPIAKDHIHFFLCESALLACLLQRLFHFAKSGGVVFKFFERRTLEESPL